MQEIPYNASRLGVHYFADSEHYSSNDLKRWLPKLQSLGIGWLTLRAPLTHAIPESFMAALREAEIQAIVHLPFSLKNPPSVEELKPLLTAYAQWGVRQVVLFDHPNLRSEWPDMGWTQRGLVERFLEIFLPLAQASIEAGIEPVFPPLEPGGDYWDTAFLRAALEEILERGEELILEHLHLGAYAWTDGKTLDWGAGGPEHWPATMPYATPKDSQDQRGFRIFDWYNAISRATVGESLPIILLAAGAQAEDAADANAYARQVLDMARLMAAPIASEEEPGWNWVPANVLACNFWLLAAGEGQPMAHLAWFDETGKPNPVAMQWLAWSRERLASSKAKVQTSPIAAPKAVNQPKASIEHYLLLPRYEWGIAEWHLDAIKPFVLEHKPTVGYSLEEASQAGRVTVVGNAQNYSDEIILRLRQAGCEVERFTGNGTGIAPQFAEL